MILVTEQGNIPLGLGGYLDIGLLDTMKDLAVNFVGAVVFSIIGYFYVKSRGEGRFARRFIPRVEKSDGPETKTETQQPRPRIIAGVRAILKPSDVRRFSYGTQFLQLQQ